MPYKTRILIWAELSRRVAPSAVAANIVDVLLSSVYNILPLILAVCIAR